MINLKNNKGAITLYILVSIFFFIIGLVSVQTNLKSKESRVELEYQKIKASYEKDASEVYASINVYTDSKYFEFTYDETNMTAQLTGIKEEYMPDITLYTKDESGNSVEDSTSKYPIYIQDGTKKITDLIIPPTVIYEGNEYNITVIQSEAFLAPDFSTYTFDDENMFTRVIIPNTVVSLKGETFKNQLKIEKVVLSDNIDYIFLGEFMNCQSLSQVIYKGITYTDYNELKSALENLSLFSGDAFIGTALANAPTGDDSCIAEGTLITLADGSQAAVEDLTGEEELLIWNLEEGRYDTAPISYIINHNEVSVKREIIHAYFSDGADVEIIKDHGFYDLDLNKIVYINSLNYNDYIGHSFVKQTLNSEKDWEEVQLTDIKIESRETVAYEVVTYEHLTCFTNGLLSISSLLNPFCNIFEVDKNTLSYHKELMNKDINKYGLFTYDDFKDLIPEYAFELYHVDYLKVALGKGLITWEEIKFLVEYYHNEIAKLVTYAE